MGTLFIESYNLDFWTTMNKKYDGVTIAFWRGAADAMLDKMFELGY
jgi:hypothetical protein